MKSSPEKLPPALDAWHYGPRVTFSVDRRTQAKLVALAESRGLTLSAVVRRIIDKHFAGTEPLPDMAALIDAPQDVGVPPRTVLQKACEIAGISISEAKSAARTRDVSERRWHVMAILSERGWSSQMIGSALGGRDRSTVLHGLGRWKEINQELAA